MDVIPNPAGPDDRDGDAPVRYSMSGNLTRREEPPAAPAYDDLPVLKVAREPRRWWQFRLSTLLLFTGIAALSAAGAAALSHGSGDPRFFIGALLILVGPFAIIIAASLATNFYRAWRRRHPRNRPPPEGASPWD